MPTLPDTLRLLHRIHRQLSDLRSRLDRGPRQIKAAEAAVVQLQAAADQARQAAQKARILADEKQLQLKSREDRVGTLKVRLNEASSNKEYQTLKEQIAADEQANLVQQDEILEALERLDELQAAVQTANEKLTQAKQDALKSRARIEAEQAPLEAELTRVNNELKEAEEGLPVELRDQYQRMVKSRGEDALAQVDGEVCGVCFQTLTAQMINELYLSRTLFCKSCGALLYLPEGRLRGRRGSDD